jgi:hypothetical protein
LETAVSHSSPGCHATQRPCGVRPDDAKTELMTHVQEAHSSLVTPRLAEALILKSLACSDWPRVGMAHRLCTWRWLGGDDRIGIYLVQRSRPGDPCATKRGGRLRLAVVSDTCQDRVTRFQRVKILRPKPFPMDQNAKRSFSRRQHRAASVGASPRDGRIATFSRNGMLAYAFCSAPNAEAADLLAQGGFIHGISYSCAGRAVNW